MSEISLVSVVATYSQCVFPAAGRGLREGRTLTLAQRFDVPLRAVGEEAEPVLTLNFSDGNELVVREHQGRLYRPVMQPDTHEPCTLEDFAAACEGTQSWRDNPFGDRERAYRYAAPPKPVVERVSTDRLEPWRKVGENTITQVQGELVARAADLLVVEGVVHVACPQPELILKGGKAEGGSQNVVRLTWTLGDMDGDDDAVAGPTMLKPLTSDEHARRSKGYQPTRERKTFEKATWNRLGLGRLREAEAFAERLADFLEVVPEAILDLVAIHDARALAPTAPPDPAAAAKRALGAIGFDLRSEPRAFIEEWMLAREDLEAGRVELCLDRLVDMARFDAPKKQRRLTMPNYSFDWNDDQAAALLLRYATVERAAEASPEESEADAISLGSLAPGA